MNTYKGKLYNIGQQTTEDLKTLDNANLEEMEKMPTWNIISSLRFLQRLCNEKNISVNDVTPELIINELKNTPRFTFN